jgi:hypothetical protein
MLLGGSADVVDQRGDLVGRDDPADRLLDLREAHGGFLHACADRHARMDQDLPAESTAGKKF